MEKNIELSETPPEGWWLHVQERIDELSEGSKFIFLREEAVEEDASLWSVIIHGAAEADILVALTSLFDHLAKQMKISQPELFELIKEMERYEPPSQGGSNGKES